MFFAPAIRSDALASQPSALDFGFERFMNDAFRGLGAGYGVEEDDKSWTLTLDVPGVAKEHLSVSITGQVVRVETSNESKRQFKGVYEMPQQIDPDGCEAKLENGVLTLKLAKAEAKTRRQITVN